jgi:hypothetical protein
VALRISVIVCAHNEERYLPACLHFVLAQTRPADDVLVISRLPQAEASLVLEDAAAMREELAGDQARAPEQRRRRVDAAPERLVGRLED